MKKLVLTLALDCASFSLSAQTVEELKKELGEKKSQIGKLQGEANALQSKIDSFPGWKYAAFGTVGVSLSGYNSWYSLGAPNTSAGSIGIVGNAYANLDREKYFWRNSLNINLSWVKNDNLDTDQDSDSFGGTNDVFTLTSLYGYKLSKSFAVSALAEYRTTLINNFNDPGYLDFGVGATWTPLKDLVVVIHPLNYNFVFASSGSSYESSLGAKIVADYTRRIGKINFKSNLSVFQSYKSSDLSNWTWSNSFGYTFWKGIGVGFDFGLRKNKQEALDFATSTYDVTSGDPIPAFSNVDNKLQSYWLFGLNYSF